MWGFRLYERSAIEFSRGEKGIPPNTTQHHPLKDRRSKVASVHLDADAPPPPTRPDCLGSTRLHAINVPNSCGGKPGWSAAWKTTLTFSYSPTHQRPRPCRALVPPLRNPAPPPEGCLQANDRTHGLRLLRWKGLQARQPVGANHTAFWYQLLPPLCCTIMDERLLCSSW